jgi:hypothetical protein
MMAFRLRSAVNARSAFCPVGVVVAVLALFATVAAPRAAASRACAALPGGPAPRQVTILRGPVSCAQARAAAKAYLAGRGVFHGPAGGPRAAQYVTFSSGWRCSVVEQGGAACVRGGRLRDPRERIWFILD